MGYHQASTDIVLVAGRRVTVTQGLGREKQVVVPVAGRRDTVTHGIEPHKQAATENLGHADAMDPEAVSIRYNVPVKLGSYNEIKCTIQEDHGRPIAESVLESIR